MKKKIEEMNEEAEQAVVQAGNEAGFRVEAGSKILKPGAQITPL